MRRGEGYYLRFQLKTIIMELESQGHVSAGDNPCGRYEFTSGSWPLNLYDCCGNSDGAAAAIITRADLAKNFRKDYVLIKGIGLSVGAGQGLIDPDFDFLSFPETQNAARAAYADAGIKIPRKEIDLAIVHDCFTITELITMEDLGFSEKGKAKYDVEAGTFTLDGELPVNTDGGLKSFGHPIGASGLRMVYEVYKQLQGKGRQTPIETSKYWHNS